jgi:hypothetical protein
MRQLATLSNNFRGPPHCTCLLRKLASRFVGPALAPATRFLIINTQNGKP